MGAGGSQPQAQLPQASVTSAAPAALPGADPGVQRLIADALSHGGKTSLVKTFTTSSTTLVPGGAIPPGGLTDPSGAGIPALVSKEIIAALAADQADAALHPPDAVLVSEQVAEMNGVMRSVRTMHSTMKGDGLASWYAANLPALGWASSAPGVYTRGAERLTFAVQPASADGTTTWSATHEGWRPS